MINRLAAAIVAACLVSTASVAQQSNSSSNKPETNCTTDTRATTGQGDEKTHNSMDVGKSAIVPEAGGADSAAPTVQSGGKPLVVGKDCPPDSKPRS